MSTTKEDRIKADFKARHRRSIDEADGGFLLMSDIWLDMAMTWKMPIQELKKIVHGDDHDKIMERSRRRYEEIFAQGVDRYGIG